MADEIGMVGAEGDEEEEGGGMRYGDTDTNTNTDKEVNVQVENGVEIGDTTTLGDTNRDTQCGGYHGDNIDSKSLGKKKDIHRHNTLFPPPTSTSESQPPPSPTIPAPAPTPATSTSITVPTVPTRSAATNKNHPPYERYDFIALRRGIRDENGDMAYYDASFVEDAWKGLR